VAVRSKRWQISPPLPPDQAVRFQKFHPVIAQILYNRGYTDPESARDFLSGGIALHDPFKMRGIDRAVGRIRTAIRRKEKIVVYGDFDADGVTSTTLLVTAAGYGVKIAWRGCQPVYSASCGRGLWP
jgi:single-stranded-DNA-specific exonuclease